MPTMDDGPTDGPRYPQSIGEPGYDDIRWFADLRPRNIYPSARLDDVGVWRDVSVEALVIAYGGPSYSVTDAEIPEMVESMSDIASLEAFMKRHASMEGREPSGECFLLIELDGDGDVIEDWTEGSVREAKEHGAALAKAEDLGLCWQSVPQGCDPATFVWDRLRVK